MRIPLFVISAVVAPSLLGQGAKKSPAERYVDTDRTERVAEIEAMSTASLGPTMRYSLRFDAEGKRFVVGLETDVKRAGTIVLAMPAWAPGSYRIVNNGKLIENLRVTQGERPLTTEPRDANTWTAKVAKGPVSVRYDIPARRFVKRSFGSRKKKTVTYQFDGPKMWMHEIRHKELPCTQRFDLPESWDVATGLEPAEGSSFGRVEPGTWNFTAENYDVLADCPTKLGSFESFGFKIGDLPFEIALSGAERMSADRREFAARVKKISKYFIDFFGGAPFKRYVYLFTVPGGGGLEHLNSTTIGVMSLKGSKPGRPVIWDFVIAHEFFHLWNVKRLRPQALGPFDYTGPNRTTALWFSEGVTSYFSGICLPRVGLWSENDYWRHIAGKFSQLRRDGRRKKMSVADSSWKVWDGSYMGSQDRIDYYLKGECLGALLDVIIRDATKNERSFDDVIRALYAQTTKDGVGFAEDDVRKTCEKIAGIDLGEFFDRYVYGVDDLPVETVMTKAGLKVENIGTEKRTKFKFSPAADASETAQAIRKAIVGAE